MYFLGIDLGSSSIKLSVFDADKGSVIASVSVPDFEMEITAPKFGWAEQDPSQWWEYVQTGIGNLGSKHNVELKRIAGIGIAYQMHGLVLTDAQLNPVRPSIIWCDSRAAQIGDSIYDMMGHQNAQNIILGSPGNFTASKLKWVKDNQPEVFAKAAYFMLPGDFIAAKLSGKAQTSTSGLSEATLWNFAEGRLATEVLDAMQIPHSLVPEIVENFGHQADINPEVASQLGLSPDVKITYRAGDQPNNALSLNVLRPGEIATTAGTSAVVYAVSDKDNYDANNRINTFLHVNNTETEKRNGVMLCINGSGILYQWLRRIMSAGSNELISYERLNAEAAKAPIGSEGLRFYPFGNGVERIFNNKQATSGIQNLNFNIHQTPHVVRAACEGIVFAMNYGFDVMKSVGASGSVVRAGKANLFLSPVFREIFANTTQTTVELYNTAGADGAARGAAYGFGYFTTLEEAFESLTCLDTIEPNPVLVQYYGEIYENWKNTINIIQHNEHNNEPVIF
ncbi:FGGY family carbohydrate kinase [Flavobacterium sp. DG1-102-2]|uniref:xylulokinase n=1 Tax=Flavobacterium sp. DG1-102-2 TaxID=3081663 RepID=UPI0029494EBA|nr:FGGY family carbohydrate kinase [Flavobacterium sp. DG1-102-2]MDV6169469.1 FGGY family carbohydrate kinase [Flavobacterium sp. DG1-102-2]